MKLRKYIPTILSIIGVGGVIATSALTAKATLKSKDIFEKEDLTKFEKAKNASRNYIPAVCIGLGTATCIITANILNIKNQAAIISASGFIADSFTTYKSKVKELYGEEAHQNIVNAIMVEKAEDKKIYYADICGNGCLEFGNKEEKHVFYLTCADIFFESTVTKVIQAEYHLNRNYMLRGFAPLAELYEFLGLNPNDIPDIGWNMELQDRAENLGWASEDGLYWIDFDHHIAKDLDLPEWIDKNREVYVIDTPFYPEPHYDEY